MTILDIRPATGDVLTCQTWHTDCERVTDLDGAADLHRGPAITAGTERSAVSVRYSHLDVLGDEPTGEIRIGTGEAAYLTAQDLRSLAAAVSVVLGQVDPGDSPTVNAGWNGHNAAVTCRPGQPAPVAVLDQLNGLVAFLGAFHAALEATTPAMCEVTASAELDAAQTAIVRAISALAVHGPYRHTPEEGSR